MTKKLLLLSVSAGAGHARAAQAIAAACSEKNDTPVVAQHWDVMDYVPSAFKKLYTDYYIKLVGAAPKLWGYLYDATDQAEPDETAQRMRRGIERLSTRALLKAIGQYQPDAIVCTHFLPAELLAHAIKKKHFSCPVWVQVTDFDLHRLWVQQGMTGYFAANEEVAMRMRSHGIAPECIHVTGIPIMPAFAQEHNRAQLAAQFGLVAQKTTVLLMGGGAGLGELDVVAQRLLETQPDFQLVVLAGKNELMLKRLQQLAVKFPERLFAQGFTNQVEQLMACADLIVTKPGGLTTSECLAMGLPMIVNSPIPGQEERNCDYLLEQGVGLKAIDALSLEYRLKQLVTQPARLLQMAQTAKRISQPHAAQSVVARVFSKKAK
jgi:processive 1,2-diacylglycerol beta-glucosyltransferase